MTHPDQTEIERLRANLRSAYATIGTKTEALRAAREGLINVATSETRVDGHRVARDTLNAIDEALRGHAPAPPETTDEHLAAEVRRAALELQEAVNTAVNAGITVTVRLSFSDLGDIRNPFLTLLGGERQRLFVHTPLERLAKL